MIWPNTKVTKYTSLYISSIFFAKESLLLSLICSLINILTHPFLFSRPILAGEHPRFGATDVCPLVPISGITVEETVAFAKQLAERVGKELQIPVYLYEYAATKPDRKNLATIRAGEYEGLQEKLADPNWVPDYGASSYNSRIARTGVTVIGARDFLIAYNVNLNTTSTRIANGVCFCNRFLKIVVVL